MLWRFGCTIGRNISVSPREGSRSLWKGWNFWTLQSVGFGIKYFDLLGCLSYFAKGDSNGRGCPNMGSSDVWKRWIMLPRIFLWTISKCYENKIFQNFAKVSKHVFRRVGISWNACLKLLVTRMHFSDRLWYDIFMIFLETFNFYIFWWDVCSHDS